MNSRMNKTKYITFFLILCLLAVSFFIYLLNKDIKNSIVQIEDSKIFIAQNSNLVEISQDVQKDKEILNNLKLEINKIYIDKNNAVSFIEKVEKIARDNNLRIQISNVVLKNSEDMPEEKKELGYGSLEMSVEVFGELQNVKNYLDQVQNLPHAIKINSVRKSLITREFEGQSFTEWSLSFPLEVITK
jgi:hypothetical protein